jgi:hypothetical protein
LPPIGPARACSVPLKLVRFRKRHASARLRRDVNVPCFSLSHVASETSISSIFLHSQSLSKKTVDQSAAR